MTDEYTPTTEQVLDNYVEGMSAFYGDSGQVEYARQFDRWLAAHDAEIRAERDSLARLHEVATERTVQLAAAIEKARAWNDHGTGQPAYWDLHHVLAAADTASALREVRAKAWEEGAEAARAEDFMAEGFTETPNPYREGA